MKFFILAVTVLFALPSLGAHYEIDKSHTNIGFRVKHMGFSKVNGKFKDYTASFDFDEKTAALTNVEAKIDIMSIDTDQPTRDDDLRSTSFFGVVGDDKKINEANRYITFKSTKVDMKKNRPHKVHGQLTIKGITKDVVLEVSYNGPGKDPYGKTRIGFEAETKINRQDFGIKYNSKTPAGDFVVGDKIDIEIDGEGIQQ